MVRLGKGEGECGSGLGEGIFGKEYFRLALTAILTFVGGWRVVGGIFYYLRIYFCFAVLYL